jgi:hypothetical protein
MQIQWATAFCGRVSGAYSPPLQRWSVPFLTWCTRERQRSEVLGSGSQGIVGFPKSLQPNSGIACWLNQGHFLHNIFTYWQHRKMDLSTMRATCPTHVTLLEKEKDREWGFESHTVLACRFNSRDYRTYWQKFGINFIRAFCIKFAVGNRKVTGTFCSQIILNKIKRVQ